MHPLTCVAGVVTGHRWISIVLAEEYYAAGLRRLLSSNGLASINLSSRAAICPVSTRAFNNDVDTAPLFMYAASVRNLRRRARNGKCCAFTLARPLCVQEITVLSVALPLMLPITAVHNLVSERLRCSLLRRS